MSVLLCKVATTSAIKTHQDDSLEDVFAGMDDATKTQKAVVKMKLRMFCHSRQLVSKLDALVFDMNRVLGEAYLFANFHITRLLSSPTNIDLPKIDRNFYYRCILAVSNSNCRPDTLSSEIATSVVAFDGLRPAGEEKVNVVGCTQILADLSISMATMASNHLWMNVWKRLFDYVRNAFPHLKRRVKAKLIVDAVLITPKSDLEALRIDNQPLKAEVQGIIAHMRALCPLDKRIPSNPEGNTKGHRLLRLYHHITKFYDELPQCMFSKRRFTLLPLKRGYTPSYIPISTMMLNTIVKSSGMEVFSGDGRGFDKLHFWSKYFNLSVVETHTRRFGCRIATDGCCVSIVMDHPTSLVCPPSSDPLLDLSSDFLSVGVDPGFDDVVTSSSKCNATGEIKTQSYSSRKYYQDSMIFTSNKKTDKWNEQLKHLTQHIPSPRTGVWGTLVFYCRKYLQVCSTLLRHRMMTGYRNMRMLRYVHKQKAIKEICDMIAPVGSMAVVGFGNWKSANSPVSRRTCGPIQEIKLELQRRTNVIFRDIDEFRTSITCHYCHCQMKNMHARSYNRREKTVTNLVSKVHKVLHCVNRNCRPGRAGHTWNRDTNASLNILMLTLGLITGEPRPSAFTRTVRRARAQ